ncbi:hypothetical protein EG329_005988 [Mollisiaceae sp. DMI_Dod_QoI]|nr:hypothetical protein EG329_005988 [Helotiales sp. DMI_Dod_QoI]
MPGKHEMTKSDASRIQSTQVRSPHSSLPQPDSILSGSKLIYDTVSQACNGRDMSSSGFASRAQSAGDRNANANVNANAGSGSGSTATGGGGGGGGGSSGQQSGGNRKGNGSGGAGKN